MVELLDLGCPQKEFQFLLFEIDSSHHVFEHRFRRNREEFAEDIETQQQWDFLRNNHCDELQGYLFSRPLAAAPFEELLATPVGLPVKNPDSGKFLEKTA